MRESERSGRIGRAARRGLLGVASMVMIGAMGGCGTDEPTAARDGTRPAAPDAAAAIAPIGPSSCAETTADDATAERLAKACGRRVEVEAGRTEYTQVYVEPSGLRTIETALAPQRARRRDGTWGPIDTTLQRVGDLLVPTAVAADVQFSGGGAGPFVTLVRDGHSFALSWPAPLPPPAVSGDTATYAEVLPDVDLVVRATATGFAHLLVVKTARAAANPKVRRASYRISGDATLTGTPGGGLIAEAAGVRIASAEPPIMWDTAGADRARPLARLEGAAEDGGAPVRQARVASAIASGHIVLTPDVAMLNDPGARFPLVIDPLFVAGENQWAYATADNQNGSTTDGSIQPGDPSPAAACLRVGPDPASSRYRSFMRFAIASAAHKQILSAKIAGKVDHTWLCGTNRPTYFYRTAPIATTPRQTWPGPALQLLLGHDNVHANEAACGEPNMPFEVSTSTLISDLQASADAGAASYFVGISAAETTAGLNETNQERWMRYFLADFKLSITYNTRPATPDTLTVDGKACVSGASRPFVKTTSPTLRAHVSDPDGDALNVSFTWAKWNGSAFVDEPGAGAQHSVPSNGTAVFNATGNIDGGIYTFRAQSDDGASHTPFLTSAVTGIPGTCEWQVDVTPPAVPTVTSDLYPEGGVGCPGGACGSVGQTGRFTFSSSPDTQSFLWGLSDPPTTPAVPAVLGGSVTVDWTPTSSGPHTLFVRAIDRAGNESDRSYQLSVAAGSTAVTRWLLNDPPGATQLVDDTGHGNTAAVAGGALGVPGRIAPGEDGVSRSAMQFTGAGAGVATSGPVLADTSRSFSLAAWVKLADNATSHRAIDQTGSAGSVFWLGYQQAANAWQLAAPTADGAASPSARSTSPPRLNTWTHLTGTYDSAAHELKLYVNGALEATTSGVTTWAADGPLQIGGGWVGALAEVQVWNRVLSASEVFALSDPIEVGNVGE